MNYYSGIGSRETPEHILNIMHHIGAYLATQGWVLRSGAANGALNLALIIQWLSSADARECPLRMLYSHQSILQNKKADWFKKRKEKHHEYKFDGVRVSEVMKLASTVLVPPALLSTRREPFWDRRSGCRAKASPSRPKTRPSGTRCLCTPSRVMSIIS